MNKKKCIERVNTASGDWMTHTKKKWEEIKKKWKCVFFNNIGVQGHVCYFFHVNQVNVIFSLFFSCFCWFFSGFVCFFVSSPGRIRTRVFCRKNVILKKKWNVITSVHLKKVCTRAWSQIIRESERKWEKVRESKKKWEKQMTHTHKKCQKHKKTRKLNKK